MQTPDEIKEHLLPGDWKKIAQIAGLDYDNTWKTFRRPGAKRHKKVLEAAQTVAQFNVDNGIK